MTVVVTGASGFVGGNLVRELLAQGRKVRAPIHQEEERRWLEGLDVEIVKGDVRDAESMHRVIEGAEVVYHLASYITLSSREWPLAESINVRGAENIVNACLENNVRRLVHFSSFHAIVQEPLDIPLDESRPLVTSPKNPPYDRSKAAGEMAVRDGIERGLDAVIISPTGIVGPRDLRPSYFGEILLSLGQGKLPALVTGGCDWVDVREVVAGAMSAEERAPSGAKYILSGQWVSVQDVAKYVAEITGVPAPRIVVPLQFARVYAPLHTAVCGLLGQETRITSVALTELRGNRDVRHDKAERELDYYPRPFRETITDTIRWFMDNGRLG